MKLKFKNPKTKTIKFHMMQEEFKWNEKIVSPAFNTIPQWYKDLPKDYKESGDDETGRYSGALKRCMPFQDALTAGYIVHLPFDIEVSYRENDGHMFVQGNGKIEKLKRKLVGLNDFRRTIGMPVPVGYTPQAWKVNTGMRIETPPGYSLIYTQPFNRPDLPFTTMTGIIDADEYPGPEVVNLFFKEGFEGILPKGTPIAQVIPFKRENWNHKIQDANWEKLKKAAWTTSTTLKRGYQQYFWKKKQWK